MFFNTAGDLKNRKTPTYLTTVDISNGLLDPQITVQEVDAAPLYKERALQRFQAEEMERKIFAKELRFTDNDQAVEIEPYDTRFLDEKKHLMIKIQK